MSINEETNMTIKKQYEEVIAFLKANSNKKVSTILNEVEEMCSKKSDRAESTVRYDDDGNVTHIFCYYHKEWESIDEVPFGVKKSTKSGYNTMCKEGMSNWTKQQRQAKQARESLLSQVASQELSASDLPEKLEEIETARKAIIPLGEAFNPTAQPAKSEPDF